MIDIALSTGIVLASLRRTGWCEYTVDDDQHAASLIESVRAAAVEAGLKVIVQREGNLVLADVVTLD